jgi:hypothetical protein
MDKMPELALKAGRKRQSKQTGFVHLEDRIPLLENFCFALALFRSRLSENVLEGKALLERLLHFQVEGNFPVYLHEYPRCHDTFRGERILPALHWILTDFQAVLEGELKNRLKIAIQQIPRGQSFRAPSTPEEWAQSLIRGQMSGSCDPSQALQHWHPSLLTFVGPHSQDKHEPAITLYDLFMGSLFNTFSNRALLDHPIHLQASLIQPFPLPLPVPLPLPSLLNLSPCHLLWGDAEHLHSLVLHAKNSIIQKNEENFLITLPETVPEEGEGRTELSLFCDIHPDHLILINQKRATTFQLGDTVTLVSKGLKIELTFSGEGGQFFGHLLRANRPTQTNKGDAYDWQIALRTLSREPSCTVKLSVQMQQ